MILASHFFVQCLIGCHTDSFRWQTCLSPFHSFCSCHLPLLSLLGHLRLLPRLERARAPGGGVPAAQTPRAGAAKPGRGRPLVLWAETQAEGGAQSRRPAGVGGRSGRGRGGLPFRHCGGTRARALWAGAENPKRMSHMVSKFYLPKIKV